MPHNSISRRALLCAPALAFVSPQRPSMVCGPDPGRPFDPEGYHQAPFPAAKSHDVLIRGDGPAVLVLHEILGFTQGILDLGTRVASSGFTAVVPRLFGGRGGVGFVSGYLRSCGSTKFVCSAAGQSSAIVGWLVDLLEDAARSTGVARAGAIGMCLTGAFPLALTRSAVLKAGVLCQPTVPFGIHRSKAEKEDLGISASDLRVAKTREDVRWLAMRFAEDGFSPPERMRRLVEEFGERLEPHVIPSGHGTPSDHRAHSILVGDYCDDPNHPTHAMLQRTLAFLHTHLD